MALLELTFQSSSLVTMGIDGECLSTQCIINGLRMGPDLEEARQDVNHFVYAS